MCCILTNKSKDNRTGYESSDVDKILDGQLDPLIDAWLEVNFRPAKIHKLVQQRLLVQMPT